MREGFVVVWPDGVGGNWNDGGVCGSKADDTGMFRAIVSEVAAVHSQVDMTRVYASGHSCGCMMSHRLAKDVSDILAAQACMAGYLLDYPEGGGDSEEDERFDFGANQMMPVPYQATPQMVIHGTADRVLPYHYSPDTWWYPGAHANMQTLAYMNNCSISSLRETWREGDHFQQTYEECEDGVEVSLITLYGVGHTPYLTRKWEQSPGEPMDVDTTQMAWDFMKRFKKNSPTSITASPTSSLTSESNPSSESGTTSLHIYYAMSICSVLICVLCR